jgi:hypothetical protein
MDNNTGLTDQQAIEALDRALCADAGIPYKPRADKAMSERSLSAEVRQMIDARQLWGHVSNDYYRRSGRGWFDWVIIGPGGILFRELKSDSGVVSAQQRFVHQRFAGSGYNCAVWRPEQLADGTIARELDAIASTPAQ